MIRDGYTVLCWDHEGPAMLVDGEQGRRIAYQCRICMKVHRDALLYVGGRLMQMHRDGERDTYREWSVWGEEE